MILTSQACKKTSKSILGFPLSFLIKRYLTEDVFTSIKPHLLRNNLTYLTAAIKFSRCPYNTARVNTIANTPIYSGYRSPTIDAPYRAIKGALRDFSLQWRHNEHDGVSNPQLHDCFLNRLFKRRSKKTPKSRATGLCAGNSRVTGEYSPPKGPVTRKMFPFDDVIVYCEYLAENRPRFNNTTL